MHTHIVEAFSTFTAEKAIIYELLEQRTLLDKLLRDFSALGLFTPTFRDERGGI
jgi:hypothetical protein